MAGAGAQTQKKGRNQRYLNDENSTRNPKIALISAKRGLLFNFCYVYIDDFKVFERWKWSLGAKVEPLFYDGWPRLPLLGWSRLQRSIFDRWRAWLLSLSAIYILTHSQADARTRRSARRSAQGIQATGLKMLKTQKSVFDVWQPPSLWLALYYSWHCHR